MARWQPSVKRSLDGFADKWITFPINLIRPFEFRLRDYCLHSTEARKKWYLARCILVRPARLFLALFTWPFRRDSDFEKYFKYKASLNLVRYRLECEEPLSINFNRYPGAWTVTDCRLKYLKAKCKVPRRNWRRSIRIMLRNWDTRGVKSGEITDRGWSVNIAAID